MLKYKNGNDLSALKDDYALFNYKALPMTNDYRVGTRWFSALHLVCYYKITTHCMVLKKSPYYPISACFASEGPHCSEKVMMCALRVMANNYPTVNVWRVKTQRNVVGTSYVSCQTHTCRPSHWTGWHSPVSRRSSLVNEYLTGRA